MFFAYALVNTEQGKKSELCIIPNRVSPDNPPVPIRDLVSSDCALYYISGNEIEGHEAIAVRSLTDKLEFGIEIKPMRPSVIYVTPHQTDRPGEVAEGIIIKINKNEEIVVEIKRRTVDDYHPFTPAARFFALT